MPHHENLSFGETIYEARKAKGWSQRETAKQLGIPHSRLAEFEMGVDSHTGKRVLPSYDKVVKMAMVFGVRSDELLKLAGYEPLAELMDEERELVMGFRQLPDTERQRLLDSLRDLLSRGTSES